MIYANAQNTCFMPTDSSHMTGWYRFNVPAPGGPTTINDTSTVETRLPSVYPTHRIATNYQYNSTNQVSTQNSPDGGTNRFWYDLLSRLVISQNDKQLADTDYSYMKYDSVSRIIEAGQNHKNAMNIGNPDYLSTSTINNFYASGTNNQIINTYYDTVVNAGNGIQRVNQSSIAMRKRVSLTTYRATQADTVTQATYFDYDLEGNVQNLYQQIQGLGIKRLNYFYDLISGKINFIAYQNGKHDQFFYQYIYDADNRTIEAWHSVLADTSTYWKGGVLDTTKKKLDATYQYYLHGPIARMEMGDVNNKVQGIDYAYTLQGWIKGVNAQYLKPALDMGQDSAIVAKDAFGYSLGYYPNDYKPIGGTTYAAFSKQYTQNTGDITGQSLYNGNISTSTYAINSINSGNPVGYTYHYDQLNWIKKLRQHSGISTWNSGNINANGAYQEDFSYDGNGNFVKLRRTASDSTHIDTLQYQYNRDVNGNLTNNQLNWLKGKGSATNLGTPQYLNNYRYDPIGNMIYNRQDSLTNITWTVYNKIQSITDSGKTISFLYGATHNRVTKTANGLTTWYVKDAQDNTIAIYDNKANEINWREQHLYGKDRVGMWQPNMNIAFNNAPAIADTIGHTKYEGVNHLDNVLTVYTDRRSVDPLYGSYIADVIQAQDNYAYGAIMLGRIFNADSAYRYGFNGKENDNEVMGTGNWQDYGMRVYDPRIGRFPSVDPITKQYPELTPYQFASNSPIQADDIDGNEADYSKAKINPLEYDDYQTQNQKTSRFILNVAINIYNNVIDAAELVSNENPVYNIVVKGRGYKKIWHDVKHSAVGVYNWTVNTSWDQKKEQIIVASHNPHVYEQILTAAILDKVSDISPMAPADAPAALPPAIEVKAAKTLNKAERLAINNAISKVSEKIVEKRLQTQLQQGEVLIEKPRIYINDEKGNLTKSYAVPDFAIIDRDSGKILRIVDAKNGEGGLTGNQELLNQRGGRFEDSSRAKEASPQNIGPKRIDVERTNIKSLDGTK